MKKNNRRRSTSRSLAKQSLRVELLEDRRLLAADVQYSIPLGGIGGVSISGRGMGGDQSLVEEQVQEASDSKAPSDSVEADAYIFVDAPDLIDVQSDDVSDSAGVSEYVFIDAAVADSDLLVEGFKRVGTQVIMLQPDRDGWQQIADHLDSADELDAIHVLSHGNTGQIFLGNSVYSTANITDSESDLRRIGQALNDSGDILLYGCNISSQDDELINFVANVTGGDVAASDDITGDAGDWDLEVASGVIEADALLGDLSHRYQHSLYTTVFSENFEGANTDMIWVSPSQIQSESTPRGPNNPRGVYALNLDGQPGAEIARTPEINLAGYVSGLLEYRVQAEGRGNDPEPDDYLEIEYRRRTNTSSTINLNLEPPLNSGQVNHNSFSLRSVRLPSDALHSNFQVEFDASDSDFVYCVFSPCFDDWFIDNIFVLGNRAPQISLSAPSSITDADVGERISWSITDPDGDQRNSSIIIRQNGDEVVSTNKNSSFYSLPTDVLGDYTVSVMTDDGSHNGFLPTATASASRTVKVDDDDKIAPTITLSGQSGTVNAASDQVLSWSIDDPSDSESTVVITRNGSEIFSRSYTTNVATDSFDFNSYGIGSYEITIVATDKDDDRPDDSQTSTATRTVNVINTDPTAAFEVITPLVERTEGSPLLFSAATSSDPDNDALTYVWDFGDGKLVRGEEASHTFSDDGDHDVKLVVVDPFGGISETQQIVTIQNVSPTTDISGSASADEMASYSLNLSVSDPGDDQAVFQVDWGDGTHQTVYNPSAVEHTYQSGGVSRTVAVSVIDEDGDYGQVYSASVNVNDAKPVISALENFYTVASGGSLDLTATVIDGVDDTLTYLWDFDGVTQSGVGLSDVSQSFPIDGEYEASLTVSDSDGLSSTHPFEISVGQPVTFTFASQTVTEDVGTVSVTAELASGLNATELITVPLIVTGAVDGDDYTLLTSTLEIQPGSPSGTVTLEIEDDELSEATEALIVQMALTRKASHGLVASQTISIEDNDELPVVYFTTPFSTVDELGQSLTFQAGLSRVAGRDIVIPLTIGGNVTSQDFEYVGNAEITIPAGSLTGQFSLQVTDDSETEMAELLQLSMGQPTGAMLSTFVGHSTVATVLISQNDAPEITLDSAYRVTSEDVSELNLRARLSEISTEPISVPYTLSGTAVNGEDFNLLTGSMLFLPGSLETSLRANVIDDLLDEPVEFFVVTLGQPANALLGASQSIVTEILDNDVARASFMAPSASVFEGNSVIVDVVLDKPSSSVVQVPVVLTGDAEADTDFSISTQLVEFAPGQTTATIEIQLNDDEINELTDQLHLQLQNPSNAFLGNQTTFALTIRDDDPLVRLYQNPGQLSEGDASFKAVVSLSAPTDEAVTIPISFSGTAKRGSDYSAPGSITVPAGDTEATFTLTIIDDGFVESSESVAVSFGAPSAGKAVGEQLISLTINDNDVPPTVYWDRGTYRVAESGGEAVLTATLSHAAAETVTVGIGYYQDSAKRGKDYNASVYSVTFAPGEVEKDIRVTLIDDQHREDTKTFSVGFTSYENALRSASASGRRAKVRITDNDIYDAERYPNIANSLQADIDDAGIEEAARKASEGRKVTELDNIFTVIEIAAGFLPPPFNVATQFTLHMLDWFGEEYPHPQSLFNEEAIIRDYNEDPEAFTQKVLEEIGSELVLGKLTRMFKEAAVAFGVTADFLFTTWADIGAGAFHFIGDVFGDNGSVEVVPLSRTGESLRYSPRWPRTDLASGIRLKSAFVAYCSRQ